MGTNVAEHLCVSLLCQGDGVGSCQFHDGTSTDNDLQDGKSVTQIRYSSDTIFIVRDTLVCRSLMWCCLWDSWLFVWWHTALLRKCCCFLTRNGLLIFSSRFFTYPTGRYMETCSWKNTMVCSCMLRKTCTLMYITCGAWLNLDVCSVSFS